jgi:hypothetical protein
LLPCREGFSRDIKGGQVFLVCDSGKDDPHVDLAAGEIPAAIFPYSDEFVKAEMDKNKKFIGWRLKIPDANDNDGILYEPHQIIRIFNFNPYNWLSGLSMYAPAQMALINDIKADIWNNRTFENDAVPSGILSSDQELTEAQANEMTNRWYQKYAGVGNARRVAVLGKGASFQKIGIDQKDMEFSQQKDRVVEEILATFGLNKIAIGKYEQINYATLVEGRKMLWEDTYIPIDQSILEQINSGWINNVDVRNEIELYTDTSTVRILKKDYSKGISSAKTMVDMKVPAAIAFRINEIPITEEDLSVCFWLNEKPADTTPMGFGTLTPGETPVKESKSFVKKIVSVGFSIDVRDKIASDYIERVLQPGENSFYAKLLRYFNAERNEMQDKVDEFFKKIMKTKIHIIHPETFLFNQGEANKELINKIYGPQVKMQLKAESFKLKEELGTLVDWGVTDTLIQQFIDAREAGLRAINSTTMNMYKEEISDVIRQGYNDNWAPGQFAKGIKDVINDVGDTRKNQARTIARTETGIISSNARFDCFKTEGIALTQWINSGDEKVRDTHADGSGDGGVIVPLGDAFPHTHLVHPCDPDGEASEIINCRCVTVAVQGE